MAGKTVPITPGDRHGRLTVTRVLPIEVRPDGRRVNRRVEAVCDCGVSGNYAAGNLRNGTTTSCGCSRFYAGANARHLDPLYACWSGMKQRSSGRYAHRPSYANVRRDPRWDSFELFAEDMRATYFPGAVLARYGDEGDYTLENCRWLTKAENNRERFERTWQRLPDGRFAIDVARENGIPDQTFRHRVKRGVPLMDATTRR